MDFNQRIDTIQVQKLVMTAKLRQSLAILNMTKTELEDEIKKQVEENPVMELDKKNKEINWEAYIKDIEKVKYTKINYNQKDDYNLENLIQTKKNLYEELKFQINLQKLNKKEKQICEYIIDSLDSDGYLRMDQNKIYNQLNIEKEFFEDALNKVQQLEPSGVGARSLEECLIIQLKNQNQLDNKIEKIINESLNLIANNKIKEICKKYNISNVECADILNKIKNLEPKPGRYFELGENFYIEPDVILQKVEEEYVVFINENDECKIKINNFYKEILKNCKEDKDATQFIKEKLNQAVNLQNDIQNRKNTLLKICEEIIKIQYEFFERGSLYLKPLTMKQTANNLDCHESTKVEALMENTY